MGVTAWFLPVIVQQPSLLDGRQCFLHAPYVVDHGREIPSKFYYHPGIVTNEAPFLLLFCMATVFFGIYRDF